MWNEKRLYSGIFPFFFTRGIGKWHRMKIVLLTLNNLSSPPCDTVDFIAIKLKYLLCGNNSPTVRPGTNQTAGEMLFLMNAPVLISVSL